LKKRGEEESQNLSTRNTLSLTPFFRGFWNENWYHNKFSPLSTLIIWNKIILNLIVLALNLVFFFVENTNQVDEKED
jgi:hypothetical protein